MYWLTLSMTYSEKGAALAPGDDAVALQQSDAFRDQLFVAGQVFVDDFAVVEDGFDFLGAEIGT
jgi:hypothetical protein